MSRLIRSQRQMMLHKYFLLIFTFLPILPIKQRDMFSFSSSSASSSSSSSMIAIKWWLPGEIRLCSLDVESVSLLWRQARQDCQIPCEVHRMQLDQWFWRHEPTCESCWSKTSRYPSCRMDCWEKARAAEMREQKEASDTKLIQEMKVNGLDGFLRPVRRRMLDVPLHINCWNNGDLLLLLPLPSPISLSWMAILLRLLKEKCFNMKCAAVLRHALWVMMYAFADVYPCAVSQSQTTAETGLTWPTPLSQSRICIVFFQPEFDLVLSQSSSSCFVHDEHVDRIRPWVPTSALLLTGSLQTGNCSMLWWTSYFAQTDTPAKIWRSGSSKYCPRMTFAYDFAVFAVIAFSWLFVCFLQRLHDGGLTHYHGADISKAARLCGIHDFHCFDHELDLTVNAGLRCSSFGPI